MPDENIEEKIRREVAAIIADELKVKAEEIKDNSDLQKDLGADSLSAVQITLNLEEKYNIEIPDEDAEKLTTFSKIVEYVSGKVKGQYPR